MSRPALARSPSPRAPSPASVALAMATGWFLLGWFWHDPLYDEVAVLASAGMVFFATWFLRWQPSQDWEPLRLMGFAAFAQVLASSGLLVLRKQDASSLLFTPAPGAFSFAVASAFVFTAMFVAGIYLTMLVLRREPAPEREASYLPDWLAWGLAIAATVYTLANAFGSTLLGRLGTAPTIFVKTPLVIALLLATSLVQKRSMKWQLSLVFFAQIVGLLMTSMMGAILLPARDVYFTFLHLRRRFPWRLAIGTAAVLLLLNPAKHVVRAELNRDRGDERPALDSAGRTAEVWGQAIERTWSPSLDTVSDAERHLSTTLSRLDYNWATAHIYTLVPGVLPFEQGRTYEDIPTVMIPRVLYPNKPGSVEHFRTRWTVRLGLQTWEDAKRTSIAIPASGEAYWNFGWWGVMLVPFGIGLAVGLLIYLAPSHPVGRAGYLIVLAASLTTFLDMLVWHIPQFIVVLITAVLVRVYVRSAPPSLNQPMMPRLGSR